MYQLPWTAPLGLSHPWAGGDFWIGRPEPGGGAGGHGLSLPRHRGVPTDLGVPRATRAGRRGDPLHRGERTQTFTYPDASHFAPFLLIF